MEKVSSKVKLGNVTISGNVMSVLDGAVDENSLHAIGPHQFRYGLGSGTFSDLEDIGEAMFIEGAPFVSWVKGRKVHTETHQKVFSPFLIGLDYRQEGGVLLHKKPAAGTSLQMFYQELMHDYPSGAVIIGHVLFSQLQSTYLVKAPIYGENINEQASDYWAKTQADQQKWVCLFSVVISEEAASQYPQEVLHKAFYKNPHETVSSALLAHTHGAVLTRPAAGHSKNVEELFNSLGSAEVSAVRHVLASSIVQEGAFAIFPV